MWPEAASVGFCDEEKFKNFHILMTRACDLDFAKKHLADKIPHFNDLYFLKITKED